ncbi:MAG: Fe-S cluster assembly protein SufD [Flavobacteriales bacterium]|nr:Fe-S cluster assembly protein SufD [Flavobacteriales bacterium]
MVTELTKKDQLLDTFKALNFSAEQDYYTNLRKDALKEIESLELPTTGTEYWKYTRLGKITNKKFNISSPQIQDVKPFLIPNLDANIIVLVNGIYNNSLSKIEQQVGVVASSLSEAKKNNTALFKTTFNAYTKERSELFLAINNAFHTDGVFIAIDKNKTANKPYHIINITTQDHTITQTRNLFVAEKSTDIKILESFVNIDGKENFINSVSEIVVGENAQFEYNKLQDKTQDNYSISTEQVYQQANSNFTINTTTLNGALVRNNLNIEVDASNCETNLSGLYLGQNNDHIDNHTIVDHKKPHCNSNEVYKGVLDNTSTGVFNGKVFVRRDAQKTNAFQANNNILLSDDSVVNSKPELEIYADDVKCSHGSTTGQIDEEAIFYLQSRGVSRKGALNLMINAFAKDTLEKIGIPAFQEYIDLKIEERFQK